MNYLYVIVLVQYPLSLAFCYGFGMPFYSSLQFRVLVILLQIICFSLSHVCIFGVVCVDNSFVSGAWDDSLHDNSYLTLSMMYIRFVLHEFY